jgi:hypothetical protein
MARPSWRWNSALRGSSRESLLNSASAFAAWPRSRRILPRFCCAESVFQDRDSLSLAAKLAQQHAADVEQFVVARVMPEGQGGKRLALGVAAGEVQL